MRIPSLVRQGLGVAAGHRRLVLVLWVAPLVPALVLAAMAASNLVPSLGRSLFTDGVLDGGWFVVLMEFRSSRSFALGPIVSRGVVVMAALSWLAQIALSAGVVETLLEGRRDHPFVIGVRRNFLRFFRTAGVLLLLTALIAVACRLLIKGSAQLAESMADGRIELVGVAAAVILFMLLWAPLDLAADLSRISAVRHNDRSMVKGFFRTWWAVVRRPGLFGPLYGVFLALGLTLHLVYAALRAPWTPAGAAGLVALIVAQQTVMILRAALKLWFWGAQIAAFRDLDEPRWCRKRSKAGKLRPSMTELGVQGSGFRVDETSRLDPTPNPQP
jgi:hypothetical protein